MADGKKQTQEEVEASFRSSLQDLLPVAQALSPHCKTIDELTGVVEHALNNDGMLRLLISTVLSQQANMRR